MLVLGVSAWAPFLLLVARGQEPAIYPFLVVHLIGVIGGSRLRALTTPVRHRRPRRQVWGRVLIIFGVLAWVPWLYQTELLGREPGITLYLALHLTGVLSGLALLISDFVQDFWQRLRSSTEETGLLARRESEKPGF